jgi:ABC-type Zn2+ transport system substrate-binding protein/surface adhesin
VIQATAGLETEEDDHEGHDHDEHAHDDHADKDEHSHDEHAHEDHADEATHTEFHAEYLLNCADPAALSEITFAYFDVFPNALEVEVQIISDAGATAYEVERDAPTLDLSGLF